jgi:hypothetical protein
VSSSIRGLERIREEIRTALDQLQLAEPWLFEFHGVAGGRSPAAEYLERARTSDVFVLVVGDEVRQGTRDEYDAAVGDNPGKVLPFLFGSAELDEAHFWTSLRGRHRTWPVADLEDVPAAVAAAVRQYLESGEIVRSALVGQTSDRLAQARAFLGVPAGFDFSVHVKDAEGQPLEQLSLVSREARYVLAGPPGAGKTQLGFSSVLLACAQDGRLPIVAMPSVDGGPDEWIAEVFDSVRFAPGHELIDQYLRDGHLAVIFDGLDDLALDVRDDALRDIVRFARRYPRTSVLVLSRLPRTGLPEEFQIAKVAPLEWAEIDRIFKAIGTQRTAGEAARAGLADLVALPFWAVLAAHDGHGRWGSTQLLGDLVSRRLESASVDAQQLERLRSGMGALARSIRPMAAMQVEEAIALLSGWLSSGVGAVRYGGISADGLLDAARRTGIIWLDDSGLRFPHPLIATYLAAEETARDGQLSSAARDDDYLAFSAALAPDAGPLRLEALRRASILGLARYLQVAPTRAPADRTDDLARLDVAFAALAANVGLREEALLRSGVIDGYFCVQIRDRLEVDGSALSIREIFSARDGMTTKLICWKGDPLENAAPEQLAALLVLNFFKSAWRELVPPGEAFGPLGLKAARLVADPAFSTRIRDFVVAWKEERARLLALVGLEGSLLDNTPGSPRIVIRTKPHDATYAVDWGATEATVEVRENEDLLGHSVDQALADPQAAAYHDLTRELESALGSAMFTQAVSPPPEGA